MNFFETVEADSAPPQNDTDSAVFNALSDPIRRAIVERLSANGAMTVGTLSAPFTVSAPAVSRHLKVLEEAGIVSRSVDRQWRVCHLQPDPLQRARRWLDGVVPLERGL